MNSNRVSENTDHALEKLRELLESSILASDEKLPTELVLSETLGGTPFVRHCIDGSDFDTAII